MGSSIMMLILAGVVVLAGIFLAFKGKSSMVRERFGSGVSPHNERKFMMTIGGGICVIGLDMLILGILDWNGKVTNENTLAILGAGIVLFLIIILIGQKHFRR